MPAPRPNRRNNPLRKLRLILGDGETPMHQELFATRVGMSVATLRSIEAGRRPMTNENCLDQILLTLGAAWNPRDESWHVLNPHSKWLYEKKHEGLVPTLDPEEPYLDDLSLHHLLSRLLDLFKATNRQQRLGLLIYLNRHFADIAKGSRLKVDLSVTEPTWMETSGLEVWEKHSAKPVVWRPRYDWQPSPHQDEGGIFDFRSRRTFSRADYPGGREQKDPEMSQTSTHETSTTGEEIRKRSRTFSAPKGTKLDSTVKIDGTKSS